MVDDAGGHYFKIAASTGYEERGGPFATREAADTACSARIKEIFSDRKKDEDDDLLSSGRAH